MSDALEKIDRFESVFRRADKDRFELKPVFLRSGLIVCDLEPDEASDLTDRVARYLDGVGATESENQRDWTTLSRGDLSSVSALLERVESLNPDVIVTYRNLCDPVESPAHSLGVMLHEMAQYTEPMVLVLPGRGEVPDTLFDSVLVVTNHLTGDSRLVNTALRFVRPGGLLSLCHIEDDVTFGRYMHAIEQIPDINTDLAREQIHDQLLTDPLDYAASCVEVIGEAKWSVTVEPVVRLGHRIVDYRAIISERQADLLVVNTQDENQAAMHGLAYSLAVEFRGVPLLML